MTRCLHPILENVVPFWSLTLDSSFLLMQALEIVGDVSGGVPATHMETWTGFLPAQHQSEQHLNSDHQMTLFLSLSSDSKVNKYRRQYLLKAPETAHQPISKRITTSPFNDCQTPNGINLTLLLLLLLLLVPVYQEHY